MKFRLTLLSWLAGISLFAQNGPPQVQLAVTDITCTGKKDGRMELTLISGALPVDFQWTNVNTGAMGIGQFTLLNQPLLLSSLTSGIYQFAFIGADNRDTIVQRLLLEPPPLKGQLAVLSQYGAYQVSCSGGTDGEVLLQITGGTLPLTFLWTNGDRGVRADSLPAGPVSVSVADARGCMLQVDTVLKAPTPILASLEAVGETCLDQNTGRITLQSVSGGVPPYQYALNAAPFGAQMDWTDLPDGSYFLHIQDAVGCVHTEGIVLPSGLEFILELSNDTAMLTGDTLRLSYYTEPPADTLIWKPAQGVRVISDSEILFFPQFSTTYSATAINADGCTADGSIRITVNRDRDNYVPNVFAPAAQDTENSRFTVYGSAGIRTVALLQVYDRFGRLWFENRNFPVNASDSGWDGTNSGDEAPSGVYLWRAVLHYTDGREVRLQGDVTLLR